MPTLARLDLRSAFVSALLGTLLTVGGATAHGSPGDEPAMDHAQHAMHMKAMAGNHYQRLQADYRVPAVTLTDTGGESVLLGELLDADTPVVLNFIFTSCTTICPILSATFERARAQLGDAADSARWVSITIDPEHDTPQVLEHYAKRFHATANWTFLTGDADTIVSVQRAFGVFRGDKMSHEAVTLLRGAPGSRWVRLEGVTSGAELAQEYQQLQHP